MEPMASKPQVLEFDPNNLSKPPRVHTPVWADGTYFTEHSYRGLAADGANGELLLLNINAKSSEQFISFYDGKGVWRAKATIRFPIRACYPQVALHDGAAHVLAIGDIVEPVEEWRTLKFGRLKREWDYVFRRLFYTDAAAQRRPTRSTCSAPPTTVRTCATPGRTCKQGRNDPDCESFSGDIALSSQAAAKDLGSD